MGEVLAILKNALNFSTTLVYDPYGVYGGGVYNETTGKWNGLVGMIHRNEADFALGKFCHHVLYSIDKKDNISSFLEYRASHDKFRKVGSC